VHLMHFSDLTESSSRLRKSSQALTIARSDLACNFLTVRRTCYKGTYGLLFEKLAEKLSNNIETAAMSLSSASRNSARTTPPTCCDSSAFMNDFSGRLISKLNR